MKVMTMFNGEIEFPIKLYYCTLNKQIVLRYPKQVRVPTTNGHSLFGTGYTDIRKTMTYIGNL